jgi:hypothetical protein
MADTAGRLEKWSASRSWSDDGAAAAPRRRQHVSRGRTVISDNARSMGNGQLPDNSDCMSGRAIEDTLRGPLVGLTNLLLCSNVLNVSGRWQVIGRKS